MTPKHAAQSKTLWVNLLLAVAPRVSPSLAAWIQAHPQEAVEILAALNAWLRFHTRGAIRVRKKRRTPMAGIALGSILVSALNAVGEGLKLANTHASRALQEKLMNKRLELEAELAKGYLSDDTKIERLYKEIPIILEAAENEIRIVAARSNG